METARGDELDDDHEWVRPPYEGWHADDLDLLPNLPRRTELIDGSLVFASPQARFHMETTQLLERGLWERMPEGWEVFQGFNVLLDRVNRLEPDIVVFRADAGLPPSATGVGPEHVLLTAEVVAPDTAPRDREVKPRKYARAGVPHFWRVEENDGLPVVYVFELEPATRSYVPSGIFHDRLKVSVPYPIEIDLTAVNRRRP